MPYITPETYLSERIDALKAHMRADVGTGSKT
jgi:hypothetical protein